MSEIELSESDEFDLDSDLDEDKIAQNLEKLALDEFKLTTAGNVEDSLASLATRAAEMLGLMRGTAQLLLHSFDWDIGEMTSMYVENPNLVAQKIGLQSSEDVTLLQPKSFCGSGADLGQGKPLDRPLGRPSGKSTAQPRNAHCPICSELRRNWVSLGCNHRVCSDCFAKHVHTNTLQERKVFTTKCPGSFGCPLLITREVVSLLGNTDSVNQLDSLAARLFIESHPNRFRHCPQPGCTSIAEKLSEGSSETVCAAIHCSCTYTFCFRCGSPVNHHVVPCETAIKWLALVDHEHQSSMWILQNTKQCPKCHTKIQRSEGCNHMSCGNCKYEFCWVCSQSWAEHSGKSFYNCVKFIPTESGTGVSLSKKQKERLAFYMLRYENHTNLAELVDDPVAKEAHNLLAWGYVLLHCVHHNNQKLILEELMTDLARDVEDMSPRLRQRTEILIDFLRNTPWAISKSISLQI